MLDISTIVVAVLAALVYRWAVNNQKKNTPDQTVGAEDHSAMPEMNYVQPLEISEFNASKFLQRPGTGLQVGAFSENAVYV